MNRWNYVEGNPINRVDPTGASDECSECEIFASAGFGVTQAGRNIGFYRNQRFVIFPRRPDKMNCKFVQWIRGTEVSWLSPTIKSNDMDTKGQWMIDHPTGPLPWTPGTPLRWSIPEGARYGLRGLEVVVLERVGLEWVFQDIPGYPPVLGSGVTYQVDLDFEIRIYDASKFDVSSPEPVYTTTWDFHQTYKAK
jgi:hypothetical protein